MLPPVIRKVNIFSKILLIVVNASVNRGATAVPADGRRVLMSLAYAIDAETKLTLNASMLARIRSDIVSCRLMPNERLRMDALRQRYQVGGTPIREALMRLEAEGLVQLEQNKGFRVSAVSKESLLDLMRCRIEFETTALRWSIENGSVEWEANLLGAFHRLSRESKVDADDRKAISAKWSHHHRAFHLALVAACGSPTLLTIRGGLFEQAERYVALSIVSKAVHRDDVDEHEQIMRAALGRDIARALTLNRAHIERTTEKVLKSLEPVQFTPRVQSVGKRPARRPMRGVPQHEA
jgi:GntR family transcriptional regulator, carbon starvation induced regulator